jgi:hypothetical protein
LASKVLVEVWITREAAGEVQALLGAGGPLRVEAAAGEPPAEAAWRAATELTGGSFTAFRRLTATPETCVFQTHPDDDGLAAPAGWAWRPAPLAPLSER